MNENKLKCFLKDLLDNSKMPPKDRKRLENELEDTFREAYY
jgi:hypothetical protein